ncbi:MAG: alcohol dehydrogenase, partial [Chlorobiaceae bacterium]
LIQHKEPVIICSTMTSIAHLDKASAILESGRFDGEKFFTNAFPVSQYEMAYRKALDSKDSIKTVLSWL